MTMTISLDSRRPNSVLPVGDELRWTPPYGLIRANHYTEEELIPLLSPGTVLAIDLEA